MQGFSQLHDHNIFSTFLIGSFLGKCTHHKTMLMSTPKNLPCTRKKMAPFLRLSDSLRGFVSFKSIPSTSTLYPKRAFFYWFYLNTSFFVWNDLGFVTQLKVHHFDSWMFRVRIRHIFTSITSMPEVDLPSDYGAGVWLAYHMNAPPNPFAVHVMSIDFFFPKDPDMS